MSKIFVGGVALPNSEWPFNNDAVWPRGYVAGNNPGSFIQGSTVGDRHQLSLTGDTIYRMSLVFSNLGSGFTFEQLDDIGVSSGFQTLPIFMRTTGSNFTAQRLINPNAVVRPVPRYSLYRTTSGTSSIQFNSTTITSLKHNTSNSRVQRAVVLLQGAGGSGGTAPTGFATRDAAGGGSGATQWIITDLYTNLTSGITVGGPGIASTGTTSANGVAGGSAALTVFQGSSSTPSNTFTAGGGGGGSSDAPNPPVGGTAGSNSVSYNPFPFATQVLAQNGAVGGGTGSGGNIASLSGFSLPMQLFGNYLFVATDDNTGYVDFGSIGSLGTMTGTTAKSGGTRPSGGGAGGAASRFGRGGNGKATTTGTLNDGLYGSGGGGGNGGVASPNNRGGTGGGGFVVLFF
jgi:hypothetical protein